MKKYAHIVIILAFILQASQLFLKNKPAIPIKMREYSREDLFNHSGDRFFGVQIQVKMVFLKALIVKSPMSMSLSTACRA